MNTIILKNIGKILEFDGNIVKIKQRLTKAEKSIAINDIISVQLKKPSLIDAGYIYFQTIGGVDNRIKMAKDLENDENSFFIGKKQYNDALKIKEMVEQAKRARNNNQNISAADEILKYKQLQEQGIITEQEFNEKKKQLLGL